MELLILGCSGSAGVPLIGCHCTVCHQCHPQNIRTRTSCLLKSTSGNLLVDIGPDFRAQALREGIHTSGENSIDGVFLTHLHYDHIGGLDEVRLFNFAQKKPMPILCSMTHKEALQGRYPYIFNSPPLDQEHTVGTTASPRNSNIAPSVSLSTFEPSTTGPIPINFCGWRLDLLQYRQGDMEVTGFACANVAYLPDIKTYPKWLEEYLQGITTLIIGAHALSTSPVQLSVAEALDIAKRCRVQKVILTHMGHEIDIRNLTLPDFAALAYDGMNIPIDPTKNRKR